MKFSYGPFLLWIKAKLGIKGKDLSQIEYAAKLWKDAYNVAARNGKNTVETKNTTEGGVKWSRESAATKITSGMSDTDRTAVLKNKSIVATIYNGEADAAVEANREDLQKKYGSFAEDAMRRVAAEFEMFKSGTEKYHISDLDIEVAFSKDSLDESAHKKVTDATQLAKLLPKLKGAVENAVGVEAHDNRYFADFNTKEFYELVGGYIEGEYFIPVRFGVKSFADGTYSLYVVVCQDKIEMTKVMKPPKSLKAKENDSRLVSISVPQIFENVNTTDLLRYIPDDFLSDVQKKAKYKAIAQTIEYTNRKNDKAYREAIGRGDLKTAARIVEAAAKKAMPNTKLTMPDGSLHKVYHGTNM